MELNNQQLLSEVIKYYEDFDGMLEESLFNWLVEQSKKADKYERTLKEIVNPSWDKWQKFNKINGGQMSMQTFLKSIARDTLESK